MPRADVEGHRDIDSLADTLRKRAPLLNLLADSPRDQRDLRDELNVSRSTVYKSLQELREADLVAERDGRYELTGFGRLAWQRHDDHVARLHRLAVGRRLIETLPSDRPVPLSLFERGQITVPGRHAPERPLDRLTDAGSRADHLRVLSPSGMPRLFSDVHENVDADEQTATILAEADAIARLRSDYDRFEAAIATDGLELRRVDERLPYAIVLFDTELIGLFGYENGLLVGAAFSSDANAIAWGERVFERESERSERM
jgi:predicted transcriptional regulator